MTYFLDAIGARQCTVDNDGFADGGDFPNGDDTVFTDDTLASRAWRAYDTDGSYDATFLPQWGTTDYTISFYLGSGANFNPSGFPSYRAMSVANADQSNVPLYLSSSTSTTMNLVFQTAPTQLTLVAYKGLNTYVIESSDTSTGTYRQYLDGRRIIDDTAHSKTGWSSLGTMTNFQLGGRYGASDYGMLGDVQVNKLWISHSMPTHAEIRDLAISLGRLNDGW